MAQSGSAANRQPSARQRVKIVIAGE